MINLGKLILPSVISVDDVNDKISLRIPSTINLKYINCVEMNLQLNFIGSRVEIEYYSHFFVAFSEIRHLLLSLFLLVIPYL